MRGEEDGVNANAIILPSLPRKAPKWILLSRGGRAILGSKNRRGRGGVGF